MSVKLKAALSSKDQIPSLFEHDYKSISNSDFCAISEDAKVEISKSRPDFTEKIQSLKLLLDLMFHDDSDVRNSAIRVLCRCSHPPSDFNMINMSYKDYLNLGSNGGGSIIRWLNDQLEIGDGTQSLDVLNVVIKFLHSDIHYSSGTPIVNSLLTVVERAFKSTDVLRLAAFKTWKVLIDNFASNPTVLCNPKRIKLLVRPLIANNNAKTEDLVLAKLDVWWHLLLQLRDSLPKQFESVVIPFLRFLFGVGDALSSVTKLSPYNSPVKKYANLHNRALDAFYLLLINDRSGQYCSLPALDGSPRVVSKSVVIDHYPILLSSLSDIASSSVKFNNRNSVDKFKTCFDVLADLIPHDDEGKVVLAYFVTEVHRIVFAIKRKPHAGKLIFYMLEKLLTIFPDSYSKLNSTSMSPFEMVLDVLFHSDILQLSKESKQGYMDVFKVFIEKKREGKTMFFLQKVVKRGFKSDNSKDLTDIWQYIWKSVATVAKRHVEDTREINEADDRVGHRFDTFVSILDFPIHNLLGVMNKDLWKIWNDVYSLSVQSAEMVLTYRNLELESRISNVCLSELDDDIQMNSSQFNNLCRIASFITESLSFSSGSNFERLNPLLRLVDSLTQKAARNGNKTEMDAGVGFLCTSLSTIMSGIPSSLIHRVLRTLCPTVVTIINPSFCTSFGIDVQAETVLDRTVNVIQARYDGEYDETFLDDIKIFIKGLLTHSKKCVRTKGSQLWQLTFAQNFEKKGSIPSDVSEVLKKNMILSSSESSQSTDSFPPQNAIMMKSFASTTTNAASITTTTTFKSSPKSFKSPLKPQRHNVDDDDSQDFVPIKAKESGKKVLTEHQKEVLTSRKDDIPALYSELSRDESQVDLPSQFQISEDSCTALDVSDVEALLSSKKEESQSLLKEPSRKTSKKSTSKELSDSDPVVNIQRLSPNKILQPVLVVEEALKKPITARELKFNEEEEDLVQSSQQQLQQQTDSSRKRKRESMTHSNKRFKIESKSANNQEKCGKENEKQSKKSGNNMFGESPLHIAVKRGDLKKVTSLLKSGGVDVNHKCHAGWMPIHESIQQGENSQAIIQLLLDHGADINAHGGDDHTTPLHEAVLYMTTDDVRFLLDHGADAYAENKDGERPIDIAPEPMLPILKSIHGTTPTKRGNKFVEKVVSPGPVKTRSKRKMLQLEEGVSSKEVVNQVISQVTEEVVSAVSKDVDTKEEDVVNTIDKKMETKEAELVNAVVSKDMNLKESEETSKKVVEDDKEKTSVPESMEIIENQDEESSSSNIKSMISLPKPNLESVINNENTTELLRKKSNTPTRIKDPLSRGAMLLEMSKATRRSDSFVSLPPPPPSSTSSSSSSFLPKTMLTPKQQNKPWQKFAPSPSNASPTAGILKRRHSDFSPKQRKVQFSDPPVSDKVEIPRKKCPEPNPPEDESVVYSALSFCDEPVSSILSNLTNKTWQKTAEKDMKDKNIVTVGDLSRMSKLQASQLKGLKPPNVITLRDALRKFEKNYTKPKSKVVEALAPFVEVHTPEEEEMNIQEIYERPSPSPPKKEEDEDDNNEQRRDANIQTNSVDVVSTHCQASVNIDSKNLQTSVDCESKNVQTYDDRTFADLACETDSPTEEQRTREFMDLIDTLDRKTCWKILKKVMAKLDEDQI